jgi:hypothetical protein
MIGKVPRYSVAQGDFPFRAIAALAGRAPIGGAREIVIATLICARLALSAIDPRGLPLQARETRASGAKNWLLSLALPLNSRTAFLKVIEASGTDDIEYLGRSLAQVIDFADPHLDYASRLELGRLVHRISVAQSGEALEKQSGRAR